MGYGSFISCFIGYTGRLWLNIQWSITTCGQTFDLAQTFEYLIFKNNGRSSIDNIIKAKVGIFFLNQNEIHLSYRSSSNIIERNQNSLVFINHVTTEPWHKWVKGSILYPEWEFLNWLHMVFLSNQGQQVFEHSATGLLPFFSAINTLRSKQDGCHFPDDIFKCIFLNENAWIFFSISLNFVPKGPINNIPSSVQIMAWHRSGDKPFSRPMMALFTDTYMRHSALMS